MRLILYSKQGCHLCEGLQEKLEEVLKKPHFSSVELEVRDIIIRDDWYQKYQYEVPVLYALNGDGAVDGKEEMIPRPSPRVTMPQLEQLLQKFIKV
jgi:glutaredoxin